jgi:hypothetical protein
VTTPVETAMDIRRQAEAGHARFPQYAGYWTGWQLGRMRRTIRRRGGGFILATKGELVLVEFPRKQVLGLGGLNPSVTVFSRSYEASDHGMNVSVAAVDVELLDDWAV